MFRKCFLSSYTVDKRPCFLNFHVFPMFSLSEWCCLLCLLCPGPGDHSSLLRHSPNDMQATTKSCWSLHLSPLSFILLRHGATFLRICHLHLSGHLLMVILPLGVCSNSFPCLHHELAFKITHTDTRLTIFSVYSNFRVRGRFI